ncbi:MAG TPA: FdhF/YdeP family oxidoreductase [Phycisphaerae bacterium]|nr:FdhF/YdeP family oxidoreductase [Phycisphaerae bacterium]
MSDNHRPRSGGGWPAIAYTLDIARRVGWRRMWKSIRSRNACKTCALGMGGQSGGMRNEAGHWPEICKKSLQAMAADMQDGLTDKFFATYGFDELRLLTSRELEAAGRIVRPLHAGPNDTHYKPIDWPDALAKIAAKLKATDPRRAFFYMSGRSSNEAAFILQLFARLYGTNHVNNCSYYCHQASGVALNDAIGSGTATITLDDLEHTDLVFLIGGNPASNHPRLMRTLMNIRRRGGHVIVINPVKEPALVNFRVPSDVRSLLFGSEIASEYVQPHIGGDIALLTGVAKIVLDRAAVDRAFIDRSCEGWEEFEDSIRQLNWDDIQFRSGVDRAGIERIADRYIAARSAVFAWTMGVTHHEHGVQNIHAIINLALMRGMVGRPHAGLLPIRGHSNVQGVGSMGVTPALKAAVFDRLQTHFNIKLPDWPGHDTMSCMQAADRGEMNVGICLGGNLFASNPDSAFAQRAIGKLDTIVYLSTTLNLGHVWGRAKETYVLPVLPRDEESQPTTQESMFNYVRLSDGGDARHTGPRSEVAIVAEIAGAVLGLNGPIDWRRLESHRNIREAIAAIIPGFEKLARIDVSKQEFQIEGRTRRTPHFPTASGKARFHITPIPKLENGDGTLRLMTVRSEGQFNTVVYEDEDLYRGQDRRDVILLHPRDMQRLQLKTDQPVTVRSEVGEMVGILARPFDIREGNCLMYYPEANVLVPARVDPRSKTPAFKSVRVTISPMAADFIPLKVDRPIRQTGHQKLSAC